MGGALSPPAGKATGDGAYFSGLEAGDSRRPQMGDAESATETNLGLKDGGLCRLRGRGGSKHRKTGGEVERIGAV